MVPHISAFAIALLVGACTPIRPLDPIDEIDARTPGRDAASDGAADATVDAPQVDAGLDAGCTALDPCNGIDDDCDPTTPDGTGDPRIGQPCDGADSDACLEGTFGACVDGALECADVEDDDLEVCDLGDVDEDCDGMADEADAVGARRFFPDADMDGWGADDGAIMACDPPAGMTWIVRGGDCDDTNREVRPSRAELCNAIDDDCDGVRDEGSPCPDGCGTATFGGRLYQFCENGRPWEYARTRCASFPGYSLVKIEDAAENDWLLAEARRRGIGLLVSGAWIGARHTGAEFAWIDGTAVSWADWGSGEPNQNGCVRLRVSGNDWGDFDCTTTADWICEAP